MAVKVWRDGDYVQASDLNEIVGSGNLAFANAAARDSFLVGSLAPVQGMTVHMLDDGVTYRRITVGASSYWAPPPGTVICSYQQASGNTISAASSDIVGNMSTVAGRSSPWWLANNKFTPQLPGFYQLDGQVAWSASASDKGRGSFFTLNYVSNALAVAIPGSMGMYAPAATAAVIYPARTTVVYLNGTTDSVSLGMYNESATGHNTVVSASAVSAISIKYLGM